MTTNLEIKGMHCASCKTLIEEVCNDIEEVSFCEVDLKAESALIEHDPSVDPTILVKEICSLGDYKVFIKK